MSLFRTPVPSIEFPFEFSHSYPVLAIGSCFAEHIGQQLTKHKFIINSNPTGIIYNPISIAKSLETLISGESYKKENLIQVNDLWCSLDFHSSFSNTNQQTCLDHINNALHETRRFLSKTKRIIISLGTSFGFRYKQTNEIVANCHKIPGIEFDRILIPVETIVSKLGSSFQKLKATKPELEIILTVSPIRHIRDGLIENQRSKASLLLACMQLSKEYSFVHYFPSYEILMDDLRDYRFYEADMIHPNRVAIDYIWDHFQKCLFSEETRLLNQKIAKIVVASEHRPFNPDSEQHQNFIRQQLKEIEQLNNNYSSLDFEKEKRKLIQHRN